MGTSTRRGEADAVGPSVGWARLPEDVASRFEAFDNAGHGGRRRGHPASELSRCRAAGGAEHRVDGKVLGIQSGRTQHSVQGLLGRTCDQPDLEQNVEPVCLICLVHLPPPLDEGSTTSHHLGYYDIVQHGRLDLLARCNTATHTSQAEEAVPDLNAITA